MMNSRFRSAALLLTLLLSPVGAQAAAQNASALTAHAFTIRGIDGNPINLAQFRGKAVLIVNTASKCSFTRQYGPLQALQDRFADKGLVILGVPSNDFGSQEPGTEDDIAKFVSGEYSVTFPMTAKMDVTGSDADPLYQWLASQAGPLGVPRWNFHKYLIAPDGTLAEWFTTMTEPDSPKLIRAIEKALASAKGR